MQRIHGLAIRAGVPLPGLAAAHTPCADVELELVERLGAPLPARIRYRAGAADDATARVEIVDDVRGHLAFRYGDGSAFDVDHRTRPARIRAAIAPGQTLEDLTAYLYGPVLGFALRAWGRLALHASCVRIGDGAVLLAGPPGAGKSTTAAALAMRGLAVVSDDLTALDLDDRGGRAVVRTVGPSRALVTLAALTYANYLLDPAMRAHELHQLGTLVRTVPVRAVTPPIGHENLDALCEAVVRAADDHAPVPA